MTFLIDADILKLAAAADARRLRASAFAVSARAGQLSAEDLVLRGVSLLGELAVQIHTHPSDHSTVIRHVADITLALVGLLQATSAIEFMADAPLPSPRALSGQSAELAAP